MFGSIARNKLLTTVAIVLTALATAVGTTFYFFELKRTAEQDLRERNFKFHDVTRQAELLYCQYRNGGVPANLKILVDQARELQAGIDEQLTSLNYITLAAVGSVVLEYDDVHEFATRGLNRAKDKVDRYAAGLVLGHIDFVRFQELQERKFLTEGRDHFNDAIALVSDRDSPSNLHLAGQLYLIWGTNELFVQQKEAGDDLIQKARASWGKLPQKQSLFRLIERELATIAKGLPPRLPCPGTIAVAPHNDEFDATFNGNAPAASADPDPMLEVPPNGNITFTDFETRFDSLANDFRSELRSVSDQITGEIRELRARLPPENNTPPSSVPGPGDDDDTRPSLPSDEDAPDKMRNPPEEDQPKRAHCDPVTNPRCCSFVVLNRTYSAISLRINGYDNPKDYTVQAGGHKRFYLPCGTITLRRSDTGADNSWDEHIFFHNLSGQKLTPTIQITDCCVTIVD